MRYLIEHETCLTYDRPVREHQCELRVSPRSNGQKVVELTVTTEPAAEVHCYEDPWGNPVTWFGIVEPHAALVTRMRARVETSLQNPFGFEAVDPAHERAWLKEALWREPKLWDFALHRSDATPDLARTSFAQPYPQFADGLSVLDAVRAAMDWVRENFSYDPDVTHVHSKLREVLDARAGVCQDFAHLLIAIVRSWGLPARYAVGYIDPLSAPEESDDRPQATHAWAQVLVPGAGWRGFDATNGLVVNDTYVTVAVGRDYVDAAPQRGSFKGDAVGAPPAVSVHVRREAES